MCIRDRNRQENLGIEEVHGVVRVLRDDDTGQQAQRHEGKAEQKRAIADLVNHVERGKPRQNCSAALRLERALLDEIKQARAETEDERRISCLLYTSPSPR